MKIAFTPWQGTARILVVLATLGSFFLTAQSADKEEKSDGSKSSTWTGTVQTGVVAIGGETTGVILTTNEGERYELDLSKKSDTAEQYNGKQVTVKGTLEVRPGVEVKERRIIQVKSIKERKAKA